MFKIEKLHPENGDIIIVKHDDDVPSHQMQEIINRLDEMFKYHKELHKIEFTVLYLPFDYELECKDTVLEEEIMTGEQFLEELKNM